MSQRLVTVCAARASNSEPALAVVLAMLAGMFAWHGELLFDVLPVRAGIDRDALVEESTCDADDALDLLDEFVAGGDPASLHAALGYVIAWLAARIEDERHSNDSRLEGPRARALTLIVRDLHDAGTELESIASRLAVEDEDRVRASQATARITAALGESSCGESEPLSPGRRG